MLRDMLRGMHPDAASNAEWRRGTLPPGRLGMRKVTEIRDRARDLAVVALRHRDGDGEDQVSLHARHSGREGHSLTPAKAERVNWIGLGRRAVGAADVRVD